MASLQSPTNKAVTDLGKRLLEASRLGDSEEVGHLMANGAPLTTDWLGTTPLHLAAIYGHTATAEVLVQSGMSRDAKTKVDKTPLHFACQHGHFEIAKLLVSGGAQINAVDMLGMTPLHWAVEANSLNIVLLLLKSGAKSSIKNKFNKTPLTIAEEKGYNPILNVLNDEEFKSLRQSDSVQEVSPKERDNARLKPLKIVDTNADSRKRQKLRKFPMIAGTWTDRKDKRKDKVPEGLTAYRPVKSAIESRLILPEPHTCAEITSEDLTKSSLTSLVSAVTSKSSVCAKTAPRSGDANGTQAVRFSLPSAADYQFAAVAPTPLSLIPQAFSGLRGAFIATPTGMMPHLASVNGSPGLVGAVPVSAFGQSPQLLLSNGHVLHRDLFQTSSLLNWMPVMPPLNLIPPNLLGTGILQAIPLHVQSPVMSMSVGNHHGAQTNLATTSAAHLSSDVSPPLSFPTTCLSIVGSIPKSTSSLTTFSSPAASLSSSMVASERSTADSARTSAMEEMLRAKRQVEDHVKEHIGVSGLATFQPPAEERRGDVLDSCRPVVSDDSRISLPASLLHKIVGGDITVHAVAVKSVQNSSLCPGALQAIAGITTEMGTIPLIPVSEGGGLQLIPIGDASCLRAQPTGTLSPLQLPLFRVPAVVSSSSALSTCMISSGVASTTVGSNPPPHLAANSLSMMAAHFGGFSVPRQALINGTSVYASQLLSSFEKAGKEDATLFGPDTAAAQLMRIHQTLLKNKTGQAETDDVDLTVTVISSSKSGQSDASPSTSTVSTPSIDAAFLPDELRFDNADDDTLEFMRYFEQAEAVIEEMEQAEERSSLQSNLRDSEQAKARDEKEKVAVQTSLLELSS